VHAVRIPDPVKLNPHAICAALRQARKNLCSRVELAAEASDQQFVQEFPVLVREVETGFRREQLVMELLGFPRLHERLEEDAIVLRALHRVTPEIEHGNVALGREVVTTLRDLLDLHRLTADLALVVAIPSPTLRHDWRVARPGRPMPLRRHRVHTNHGGGTTY
jgi:hemerythrin